MNGFAADSQSHDYEWVNCPSLFFGRGCEGFYLSCLVLMAWFVNLSCVSVNFHLWTARLGASGNGQFCSWVAPCIYIVCGYSLHGDVHLVVWHVAWYGPWCGHGGVRLCYQHL